MCLSGPLPYIRSRLDSTHGLLPSFPTAAAGPAPVPFTLNFTINNLHYTQDMRPSSTKFNSTASVLQRLVRTPWNPALSSHGLRTLFESPCCTFGGYGGLEGKTVSESETRNCPREATCLQNTDLAFRYCFLLRKTKIIKASTPKGFF